MSETFLVTGNCGYVGAVMTGFLKAHGHRVIGLDCGLYRGGFPDFEPVVDQQVTKDIRQVNEADFDGVDVVVHLAALSNDPLGELAPTLTRDINTEASLRAAAFAKRAGVGRFLFASSCSIYGVAATEHAIDESGQLSPATEYARSKVDVEAGLAALADRNFHPVFLRNATVYGDSPCLRLDLVVNNLTAAGFTNGQVVVLSDGSPWRPILHVEDMARAFLAAARAPVEVIHGQAYNVGQNRENYQVREIAQAVQEALPQCTVEIRATSSPDERTYRVDFGKIAQQLPAFNPQWTLRLGIEQLIHRFRHIDLQPEQAQSPQYYRVRWIRQLIEQGCLDRNLFLSA